MDTADCDIAVVGAGAAGLAAALFAAEANPRRTRIAVLDSAPRLGKKILISGGGRCNVTHDSIESRDFNGPQRLVRNILSAFTQAATVRWMESLGVPLKREETGKLFPVTDDARTVLNALLDRCRQLGVELHPQHRVDAVDRHQNGFAVTHQHGVLRAERVLMATGGRSLPRTGSDGSGWDIVRRLGHTVTAAHQALVPLVLRAGMFHAALSGISQPAELTTLVDGKRIDRRSGSLLWTHFGISGPVVMDASRHWTSAHDSGRPVEMRCNFLPGWDFERAERWLIERARARPRAALNSVLAEELPDRVAGALAQVAEISPPPPVNILTREQRRRLVHALTDFLLPIECARGWDYAEVTAGGVPLQEIDYRTMESRVVPGLYLIGEMLDCDGRIGGFNFQWAWTTAHIAGRAAAGGDRM